MFLNNKKYLLYPQFYENCFITDIKEKPNFSIFPFPNNALLFLIIVLFLLMSTILLTNVYLQLHFQPKYWKNHPHAKNMVILFAYG